MNLLFSYSINDDKAFEKDEHIFLGAGKDNNGSEVHIWLKNGESFPVCHFEKIKEKNINQLNKEK